MEIRKPWSTFIRLGLFFTLSALYAIETDVYWWQAFGMLFAIHFLLFDYIINKIRNQSFFYVSDSNHWYEKFRRWFKTPVFELMFKIWLLLVAYGVYAHLDWII